MKIKTKLIIPESGPCPKCNGHAQYSRFHFDSRTLEVSCGKCGSFKISKPRLENRLEQLKRESIEAPPQRP